MTARRCKGGFVLWCRVARQRGHLGDKPRGSQVHSPFSRRSPLPIIMLLKTAVQRFQTCEMTVSEQMRVREHIERAVDRQAKILKQLGFRSKAPTLRQQLRAMADSLHLE